MLPQEVEWLGTNEWRCAHQQLVDHRSQGVEIGSVIDAVTTGLLWAHVIGRSENDTVLGQGPQLGSTAPTLLGQLREPKVDELETFTRFSDGDDHIFGFEIPVHNAPLVGVLETPSHLKRSLDGQCGRHRVLHMVAEVFAIEKRHDQIVLAVLGGAGIEDTNTVFVIQTSDRQDFAPKPLFHHRHRVGRGEQLDGDGAFKFDLRRTINRTHTAGSDERLQSIPTADVGSEGCAVSVHAML